MSKLKKFIMDEGLTLFLIVGVWFIFFAMISIAQADPAPAYGEPAFQEAIAIDTDATGQILFKYDRSGDGLIDYVVARAQKDIVPVGPVFADFDSQYLLVPRNGYYLVRLEPNSITTASHKEDPLYLECRNCHDTGPPGAKVSLLTPAKY